MDERGAGAAGPFKGVPGILGERARLIRGGDHGRTGAAVAWSRGRVGEGDACSWARTVGGSRVERARQAGRGGNWADVRRAGLLVCERERSSVGGEEAGRGV